MAKTGFTNGRAINLDITAANTSPDAIKSLLERLQEYEDRIANGESISTIAPGSEILLVSTSKTQYGIYVWSMSANFGTGAYVCELLESPANVETATTSGIG